ncbi:hypothetical protein D3C78_1572700 [compost metagenome]
MITTATTVAITAEVRKVLSMEKALSLSTDRPMYQLAEGRPVIGVKVSRRAWPSLCTSVSSPVSFGVCCGNRSDSDFITRSLSGCTRILPWSLTRKA